MIKWVASATVVTALGMAGMSVAESLSRRCQELRTLSGALSQLETEISYGLTPLPTAWRNLAKHHQGAVRDLFQESHRLLSPPHRLAPEEAWARALEHNWERFSLRKSDREILLTLGASLGRSDREDQVRILRLARMQLAQAEGEAEEVNRRTRRLWNYSGFLLGTVVVLLAL